MNITETLNYIHSLNMFGIKPGLERIGCLMNLLDNPQDSLNFIHVAGTNGKGSVSTMLSNILISDGRKTGLFISPYVVCFNERIQINGQYIDNESLCRICEKVMPAAEKTKKMLNDAVTEFEFITAVAFMYFKEQICDTVVLETGLGGRLDSTNIIKSNLLSVITKINLDHIGVLGDTVEKIAFEKCGIIKNGTAVISSDEQLSNVQAVIEKSAVEKNNRFIVAKISLAENIIMSVTGSLFIYKGLKVKINMPGIHQIYNAVECIEAAIYLGISEISIVKGISITSFPCRLEIISKNPLVIIDGAHNPDGAKTLQEYLKTNKLSPIAVCGMMKDKDTEGVIKEVAPLCSSIITVTVKSNSRSITGEELAVLAKRYCNDVCCFDNYDTAIDKAFLLSKNQDKPVLFFGSLYLASDIRNSVIYRQKH